MDTLRRKETMSDDPVCIVGIGCRYPGEDSSIQGFWDTIVSARSTHSDTPHDRFDPATFHHPNHERAGAVTTKGGYFLKDGVARFDAPFFSITANEAASMDPQQRMLLEVAYETFENAGLTMDQLRGSRTGCYVGTFTNDYEMAQNDIYDLHPYAPTGTGASMIANRVSWFYDLRGPSLVVDTACSSSMYAFHLACQSVRLGESTMALVGGSNTIIAPAVMRTLSSMRFLSPTGQCHSYDQSADGYARGEGVGMLLLKRLSDAIACGDTIRAVVRSSGVNQDGNTPGVTVPSASAQAALIQRCYEEANLSMDETAYFEGHGTGTLLGDPIELEALGATFGRTRTMANALAVGSVKANVGHQEGGAGVAGLIRAILALEKGIIPPTAGLKTPNLAFRLSDWKIDLPNTPRPWPRGQPRRISINSFGYGGANSHVILEEARGYMLERQIVGNHNSTSLPTDVIGMDKDSGLGSTLTTRDLTESIEDDASPVRRYLFAFSGFDQAAVARLISQYSKFLNDIQGGRGYCESVPTRFLSDLAFTLAERRTMFPHRIAFAAGSIAELAARLQASPTPQTKRVVRKESVAFVFTGQGAQYCGMGRGLLLYNAFRRSLDRSNATLTSFGCEWDLIEEILRLDMTSRIDQPQLSQPVCTAIQIAQVDLLASWGVHPKATIGHSSGEIAAAYASGRISLEDAIRVAYNRGIFSAQASVAPGAKSGAMLAVGLSAEEASSYVRDQNSPCTGKPAVVIACINSPRSVTLSGDLEAIRSIESRLKANKIFAKQLRTQRTAYHSPHMDVVASEYLASLSDLTPLAPGAKSIPMFSSVTGDLVANSADLDASYWVRNMLQPVKFSEALQSMLLSSTEKRKRRRINLNHSTLLELGPSAALKGPINQILQSLDSNLAATTSYASMLKQGEDDQTSALTAMAQLWATGTPVLFAAVNQELHEEHPPRLSTDLPAYPWSMSGKMWHDSTMNQQRTTSPRTDLLGYLHSWQNMNSPVWRNIIRIGETPWLADHKIYTTILYPGSSMIVMALEAAHSLSSDDRVVRGYQFRDIIFHKALVVPPDGSKVEVQLHVWAIREGTRTQQSSRFEFSFVSLNDKQQWDEHCHGYFQIIYDSPATEVDANKQRTAEWTERTSTYDDLQARLHHRVPKELFYRTLRRAAMMYGPTFRGVETVYAGKGETHGVVVVPNTASVMPHGYEYSHLIHPATLDAITQLVFGAIIQPDGGEHPGAYVPTSIGKLYISANLPCDPGSELRGYALAHKRNMTETVSQIVVSDSDWSEPKVIYEEMVSVAVAQGVMGQGHRRKCAQLNWVRHIHHSVTTPPVLHLAMPTTASLQPLEGQVARAIRESLDVLRSTSDLPQHLRSLEQWTEKAIPDLLLPADASASRANRAGLDALVKFPLHLKTLIAGGERLAAAVTKDVLDAVVGATMCGDRSPGYAVMDDFIEDARRYNPGLSILLIGDGTPYSAACHVAKKHLSRSTNPDGVRQCVSTEIDAVFLNTSQESQATAETTLPQYTLFNPATSDSPEGINGQVFDLVVCSPHVAYHKAALARIAALLSPNGNLVVCGALQMSPAAAFFLGLSESWWSFATGLSNGHGTLPAADSYWETALRDSGLRQQGSRSADAGGITFFATRRQLATAKLTTACKGQQVALILHSKPVDGDVADFEKRVEEQLTYAGCSVTLSRLGDSNAPSARVVICLADLSREVIGSMSESTLIWLRSLVSSTRALVWVTRGAVQLEHSPDSDIGLDQSLATGLFRSIRSEFSGSTQVHVDVSPTTDLACLRTADLFLDAIVDEVFDVQPDGGNRAEFHDRELVIDGQHVLVPRVVWDTALNKELAPPSKTAAVLREPLHQTDRALRLVVENPGHLDSLRWVDDDAQPLERVLAAGECLIKVKAWPINFMDVMAALGQIPTRTLGIELAGEVVRCGPACTRVRPGMRVTLPHKPTMVSFFVAEERRCEEVPPGMDLASAASVSSIYVAAYLALVTQGRLQRGETVLIHAAAGGLGQACVQIAQWLGATVYATVGSNYKRQLLTDQYGIPAEHIFSSRDLSFATGIMRVTAGKGVNVAINSLAGEALRATWDCIAAFGRFIELGKRDILNNAGLDMAPFLRQVTFSSVNAEIFHDREPGAYEDIWHKVWHLLLQGNIRPVFPITRFHIADAEKAIRLVASGAHAGKVVLTTSHATHNPPSEGESTSPDSQINTDSPCDVAEYAEDKCLVTVPARKPAPLTLDASATYVLCGGFGGIGRVIARLLANHGAKHLVLLSRSGATNALHHSLLRDMDEQDVQVTVYNCDISDAAAMATFASTCKEQGWAVKGVVQCAMVLRDRMFNNMSHDDWTEATRAKTQGTKQLSDALPDDMDFFIMLSSISGIIGNKGQANYAAANTYMDALAIWRRARGLKATALDLGVVSEAGYLAEHPEQLEQYSRAHHLHITNSDLTTLLRAAMRGCTSDGAPVPAQIIAGYGTELIVLGGNQDEGKYLQITTFPDTSLDAAADAGAIRRALASATSIRDVARDVEEELAIYLARALAIDKRDIDVTKPLHAYGVDSLVAVDLRNWISRELAADVVIADILSPMPIQQLALKVASVSSLVPKSVIATQLADITKELNASLAS